MHLLLLFPFWLSGTLGLTNGEAHWASPEMVRGWERNSVTVICRYGRGWDTYNKYWCRGAKWNHCKILVQTSGSEEEVKKDRVSIRDNHRTKTFTVTMKELRLNDTDTYWCGIERIGRDHRHQIQVTVDSVTIVPTTTSTIAIPTTIMATPEETKSSSTVISRYTNGAVPVKLLIPLIIAVLLLLLVAVLLLKWRMLKRQKEAAGRSPEQELQHPEGEIYTNLTLQQTEASLSSPQKKATDPSLAQGDQEEVDYTIIASFQKEDISYATLSLDTSNPEPTYGNMDYFSTHTPSRSQEEHIEYSIIRRT